MITFKRHNARCNQVFASAGRACVSYGTSDNQEAAILSAMDESTGTRYTVHISSDEIDRLVEARNQYLRETAHRGYPAR